MRRGRSCNGGFHRHWFAWGRVALLNVFVGASSAAADPPDFHADLVLTGGKVWTVDAERPEAEAVAVWRDRIVAIGANDDVRRLAGPGTRVIDLAGRRVVPGFGDSHVHLLAGGLQLGRVDLTDAADEAEFGRRLRAFDRKLPPGRWMLGGKWDHDRTFEGELPTAELIDRYVPDRPVFMSRYDGHSALVNSRTLALAGITAETTDPPGGEIRRKSGSREPTGILRDAAMDLVVALVPATTEEELAEAIGVALEQARRLGVTSIDDMAGEPALSQAPLLRLYQQLHDERRLTARIHLRWPLENWRELAELGLRARFGGPMLAIGGVKGFVDGSAGSATAKMWEPFLDEPSSTGIFLTPPERLDEWVRGADGAGLAVAVHAIGDRANSMLLDLFALVQRTGGERDRRLRIEHAQHLRPDDFRRFADLSVVASMQPYHAIDDGRWIERRIGPQRCQGTYAFRSLLEHGARLAFGSDWPVAPLDPLKGIDAAVNRRTLDGKHPEGWYAEERITVAEAVEAYTLGSAYALGREAELGSIAVGKLADLVVLSRDIFDPAQRDRIAEARVEITIVGGKVVYEAE
jgi:predicted amidohydrolase YtcJ